MARRTNRTIGADRRRSRPIVEGLESRHLMALFLTGQYSGGTSSGHVTQPSAIIDGPDGNLWFSQNAVVTAGVELPYVDASIGELNPTTGAISTFELAGTPHDNQDYVGGIAVGPDKNLWFTDGGPAGGAIGMINPTTHVIVEFPVNGGSSSPFGIAAGPDGNLWFTDEDHIGKIDPTSHTITEFPLYYNAGAAAIVAGPDGNIWFLEQNSAHYLTLGKINPTTFAIVLYDTGSDYSGYLAQSLTLGRDGNLWFVGHCEGCDRIALIDPTTGLFTTLPIPGMDIVIPGKITSGPDGNLYFTEQIANPVPSDHDAIVEVDPMTHAFSSYPIIPPFPALPGEYDAVRSIVTGPDGNLWATGVGQIDKILVVPASQSVIRSNVYSDPNQDGTFAGGPLARREVYLDLKRDGTLDPGDPTAITDGGGYYTFLGLTPGTYTVRLVTYPGDTATGPAGVSQVVTASGGQVVPVYTFGVAPAGAVLPLTWSSTPFGSHNPDVSTAEVKGLYRTILGRAPDAAGGAAAIAALKGGTPLAQITASLFGSAEYATILTASDYEDYLGRAASPAELSYVVHALRGGLTPENLAAGLMASPEFSLIHASDADFLTAAYGDTLGRPISSSELSTVEGLITGGLSRAAVIVSLLGSTEADQRAANGFARVFLGLASDPDLAASVAALQGGTSMIALATSFGSGGGFVGQANGTVG